MTRVLHPLKLILVYALTSFIFSGCAAGPQSSIRAVDDSGDKPIPVTTLSVLLRNALNAIEEGDHETAVKSFDKILKEHGEIQEEYLFDYGLALNKAGRYQDAIRQLTLYLDAQHARGFDSLPAKTARSYAKRKLQALTRAEQTQQHLRKYTEAINANWQTIATQLATKAATITEPLTGMELVLVSGGCYMMGDTFGTTAAEGLQEDLPVHEVCVDDFYLGRYEVTQAEWQTVMGYNPSANQQGGDYPVEMISWHEALRFTEALSGSRGRYRLPTEAEWEYAARSGGQQQQYSGSNNIDEVAWYVENSGGSSHPVGQKQPNGSGLYDMTGNLYEWCLDRFAGDYYQRSPKLNPPGDDKSSDRGRRGGSWQSTAFYSRTSDRSEWYQPFELQNDAGLRLALPLPQTPPSAK